MPKNWELDRIAYMDILIMEVALSELMDFPTIPVNVTLNEYIEIAKNYSTEKVEHLSTAYSIILSDNLKRTIN